MAYRLISATPSPYARKVRIVLLEKGIPFDLLTEVPWDSTTTKPRHKPLEKLPILLVPKTTATSSNDPDGFTATVFESHHILAYLEIKHPSRRPCCLQVTSTPASSPSRSKSSPTASTTRACCSSSRSSAPRPAMRGRRGSGARSTEVSRSSESS